MVVGSALLDMCSILNGQIVDSEFMMKLWDSASYETMKQVEADAVVDWSMYETCKASKTDADTDKKLCFANTEKCKQLYTDWTCIFVSRISLQGSKHVSLSVPRSMC